ncbi:MAG: ferrous iron transport protein B [Planctomycetota bacterium]|nr:ferrous iron transport protein B [Planctomycetota bacterium]
MSSPREHGAVTVALLGNPNTGKSTVFQALSGVRQRVGNYPGVTVEKKIGKADIDGRMFSLVDLPGTYSLAPRSPDEMVTVDVLLGRREEVTGPDVMLCIVDASNLERNLYLVSQVLELGRPTVVALNMVDVAADKGVRLDVERLCRQLHLPIVATQAHRGQGIAELKQALRVAADAARPAPESPFPQAFQQEVTDLEQQLRQRSDQPLPRYLVERLLLDVGGYLQKAKLPGVDGPFLELVAAARQRLQAAGIPIPAIEARARYAWVSQVLDGVATHPAEHQVTASDRLDRVLTHPVWGTCAFVLVMLVMFQSIFSWAKPAMSGLEHGIAWLGEVIGALLPIGALRSLLVDGVMAGVGGVLMFLPQILILFLFIAVLEDCGYMARAAYLMDKLMCRIGLSGKSFIPLLASFACAVPGIMATRVIENRRDRLVTILVAPLMSCSARLPVYTLLIAAFIPDRPFLGSWLGLPGITMFALYLLGIIVAVCMTWLLKTTLLRGETPPFLMELPNYKVPAVRTVLARITERGWLFIRDAGTLILAVTVLMWAAAYFPHSPEIEGQVRGRYQLRPELADPVLSHDIAASRRAVGVGPLMIASEAQLTHEVAAAYMEQSYLGRAGKLIEPVVRPLGWDWKIGCAVIASFPAREVVISTLGVIYHVGEEPGVASESLQDTLKAATYPGTQRPVFTVPVALSVMVFFALCAQCVATLAVIRRETNSWTWPAFTFAYMTVLAYAAALVTYQVGTCLFS